MKKYFFYFIFFKLVLTIPTFAQTVDIPDASFKNILIFRGVDKNNDNQIQVSEALAIKSLDVNNCVISDLTGIEAFVNLRFLDCSNNSLTSLDLSHNTALDTLFCVSNLLKSLKLDKCIVLTLLNCSNNPLTDLNVNENTVLKLLSFESCKLSSIDLSQNKTLLELYCPNNSLTNLNVSNNTTLITLSCFSNQLKGLDVSQNIKLKLLDCGSNSLNSLTVENNVELTTLICDFNSITNLNVSNNIVLTKLYCNNNMLNDLDVRMNIVLKNLRCEGNPDLATICVNNINYAASNFTKNISAKWSESCDVNGLYDSESTQKTSFNPNPSLSGFFNIQSDIDIKYLIITDMEQRIVLNESNTEDVIDLSSSPRGVYFVQIHSSKGVSVQRLIVE
jgi:Leucine-rich repeat (LRR) protein